MKLLTLLLSLMFILGACGEETIKSHAKKDSKYDYIEIEECTIPVLKELNVTYTQGKGGAGNYDFFEKDNKIRSYHIGISHKYKNVEYLYITRKQKIKQSKTRQIISEQETDKLKIIEWEALYPVKRFKKFISYDIFAKNTIITLSEYGEEVNQKEDLNYLLDYCQKTWKLDNEKEN